MANGIAAEASFPYDGDGDQQCMAVDSILKVIDWSAATTTEQRKRVIAFNGPVIAGMRIFEDFPHYKSGVYRHVTGGLVGLHAVCVVGYEDDDQCWIVKNSWGADWGEEGFFRIQYGDSGLDTDFPFFDPDVALT